MAFELVRPPSTAMAFSATVRVHNTGHKKHRRLPELFVLLDELADFVAVLTRHDDVVFQRPARPRQT